MLWGPGCLFSLFFSDSEAHVGSSAIRGDLRQSSYLRQRQLDLRLPVQRDGDTKFGRALHLKTT